MMENRGQRYTRFSPPSEDEHSVAQNLRTAGTGTEALASRREASEFRKTGLNTIVLLFVLSLFIPIKFNVGALQLSPSRVAILLSFTLCIYLYFTGKAGRRSATDYFVFLLTLWILISLMATEGLQRIEFIAISCIEALSPYLIARCFIRSTGDLSSLIRLLYLITAVLMPIAALESLTGVRIAVVVFEPFFQTIPWSYYPPRLGLYRAQTVFEHAILFGTTIAFAFCPVFYLFINNGKSIIQSFFLASPVLIVTFLSLSAGAYLSILVQLSLILWLAGTKAVKHRWWLLTAILFIGYILLDIVSNRTPFQLLSSYVAFDQHTAFWRVLIFRYGIENVWAHPIVGIGLRDWSRPEWMYSASIDNLWLVFAVRHGVPGFLLLALSYASAVFLLAYARGLDTATASLRLALIFSYIGLIVTVCTVHLWNAAFLFSMFMLGAGQFIPTCKPQVKRKHLPYRTVREEKTGR